MMPSRTSSTRSALFVAASIFGLLAGAKARAMDYGALQDLFGEPVTVSATGTPQRASDVAANMTIITADEIRRAGVRNIAQIVDLYVPGLDLVESSNGSFDVAVRGYQQAAQTRLQVLVDGRQVFVDDYSRTIWDGIPVNIDDIRQIEVVKGAASALFGSNAAAGAINIVTYGAGYDRNRVFSITGGSQSTIGADTTMTLNDHWGGFKLSAGTRNAEHFESNPGPFDAITAAPDSRYVTGAALLDLSPSAHANLDLAYANSHEAPAVPFGNAFRQSTLAQSVRGGLEWQTQWGTMSSDTYYNHDSIRLEAIGGIYPVTSLLVSRFEDKFASGPDNIFRLTFEYRDKQLQARTIETAQVRNLDFSNFEENEFSLGASWLWRISDAVSWTNAVRIDHLAMHQVAALLTLPIFPTTAYNHSINSWSANSGLIYKVGADDTFRLTYGRGIILPSLLQSGDAGVGGPHIVYGQAVYFVATGNPYLLPTKVQNVEFSHTHQFESLSSTLSTSVFYSYNNDILSAPDGASGPNFIDNKIYVALESFNAGSSRSLGGEIEFKGKSPSGFRWDASYSYIHIKDSILSRSVLDFANSTPAHHIRLSGGYSSGPWEFDINGQYVSARDTIRLMPPFGPVPQRSAGYVSIGGRIAYNFLDRYSLALSTTNINHETLRASAYPAIERQVFATLTAEF
jgi:iron complex outermembrane receptor protein